MGTKQFLSMARITGAMKQVKPIAATLGLNHSSSAVNLLLVTPRPQPSQRAAAVAAASLTSTLHCSQPTPKRDNSRQLLA